MMTVREFAQKLNMEFLTGQAGLEKEITGVYTGDLLSWVMSHAQKGDAWITVLTNINIVAVAVMTEASCIILPEGIKPDGSIAEKAEREGIPIAVSGLTAFQICCEACKILNK